VKKEKNMRAFLLLILLLPSLVHAQEFTTCDSVDHAIKKILIEQFGVESLLIDFNEFPNQLQINELDSIEFVIALEERFDIQFSDSEAEQMYNLRTVSNAVCGKILAAPKKKYN